MGSLDKKDSAPSGPRPKREKPRARRAPAPTTPERRREGVVRVRDDADSTTRELEYEMRVLAGEIKREASKARVDARLESYKKSKKGLFIDRAITDRMYERMRAFRKKRAEWQRARREAKQDLARYIQVRRFETLSVITHVSIPVGDTKKLEESYRRFHDVVSKNFNRKGSSTEQLQSAELILSQLGVTDVSPEYARAVILDLKKQEKDVALMDRGLDEEQFSVALMEQAATTDDSEKAVTEALKQASPELRKAYEEYLAIWRSENTADIFAPPMPEIPGATEPSESDIAGAVNAFTGTEVKLDFVGTNYGNVSFGKIRKPALLLTVNDELKLYILDPNADRGRRGPINLNPAEVRAELAHSLIDDEFSRQFRHFVGRGTEVDPQEIADAKLFKIVHAFLPPGSDEHMDRLDATQQSIIINLAILFATPDKKYISLQDKARFLNDLKPDRLAIAKKKLHEQCFPEKFSLSEFDSSFASS